VRDGDGGGDGGDDGRGDGGGDGGGPASTTSAEGAASPAPSTTSTGGAVVALMLLLQLTSCRWLLGAVSAGEWLGVSEGFKCLLMADELPTPSPADYANYTIPKSIIKDYKWEGNQWLAIPRADGKPPEVLLCHCACAGASLSDCVACVLEIRTA
jgi:hypothetical protein